MAYTAAKWGNTFRFRDDRTIRHAPSSPNNTCYTDAKHAVASSDARNIKTSIRQEGDEIVINGHKWLPVFIYFVVADLSCTVPVFHLSGGYRVPVIPARNYIL